MRRHAQKVLIAHLQKIWVRFAENGARSYRFGYGAFRRRAQGPPPFSSMNSSRGIANLVLPDAIAVAWRPSNNVYTMYLLKEITMLVEFCKWGNSLAVRIPKTLAEALKVGVGRHAEIAIENGALVLRPIKRPKRKPTYTLEELLRGMTKENLPQEVDWGEPRGNEAW